MVVEPGYYPLLLHEAVTYLGRQPHERAFTVGEPMMIPVPVKEDAVIASMTFQQPGAELLRVAPVQREGQTYAELLGGPERPGFFEIRTDVPTSALFTAVNVDPRESRVQSLAESALRDAFQGLPVRLVPEGSRIELSVQESRVGKELWKGLLLAALLVLLIEGVLALHFTRRATAAKSTEGPAVPSGAVPSTAVSSPPAEPAVVR